MNHSNSTYICLNCQRSETEIPLVALRHDGQQAWICSQCLPILIHHPQRLAGKLDRAEQIEPVPPESH